MSTLIDDLKSRLLFQFKNSPNINALFESICERFQDTDDILQLLLTERSLDDATGYWLDLIGAIVGVPRNNIPAEDIFTFKADGEADDTTKGFFSAPSDGGRIQSYQGLTTSEPLDDASYRKQIRAKAIANFSSGTLIDIYKYIYDGFGIETSITDENTGEVVIILLSGYLSQQERYAIMESGPVSAGIRVEIPYWEPQVL